jgi:hypothetical protein
VLTPSVCYSECGHIQALVYICWEGMWCFSHYSTCISSFCETKLTTVYARTIIFLSVYLTQQSLALYPPGSCQQFTHSVVGYLPPTLVPVLNSVTEHCTLRESFITFDMMHLVCIILMRMAQMHSNQLRLLWEGVHHAFI